MQRKVTKRFLPLILCMVLIVATALFTTGCNGTDEADASEKLYEEGCELGEGKMSFPFIVVEKDGTETEFLIKTDKEVVGDALLDVELIEGEDGDYGLYVKRVNGILADYNVDGTYWAFYINDEYAMSGVDMTPIVEGEKYSFKVE